MAETPTLGEIWSLLQAMHEHDKVLDEWQETVTEEICRLQGRLDLLEGRRLDG